MIASDQRAPADPRVSAWVSAAAGTGKTRVLTNRVLRLLLEGNPPGRLLCLTFTKAAAAEMTNRVHGRLAEWARLPEAHLGEDLNALLGAPASDEHRERARRLFVEVLEAPSGLRIQTIHAFCESVLGRFPLEANLAPHFAVADERTAAELLDDARDRVLWRSRGDSSLGAALGRIVAYVSEREFSDVMAKIAADRGRIGRLIAHHGSLDRVLAAVRAALGLEVDEDEGAIIAAACADHAFDGAALGEAAAAMRRGGKTDAKHGQVIAEWLADPAARVAGFDDYLGVFFTQGNGNERKTLIHRDALALAPGAGETLAAEARRLSVVRERRNAAFGFDITAALLALGLALIEVYSILKRRRAMLDYDDLILHTRDLLQRPGVAPWVLYKLDGGLDHILIDEAQDTNPEQWEVIAALAEEFFAGEGAREADRTIFAVGDAKQSIYGFQRADPTSFARWREYFANRVAASGHPWRAAELVRSFRTTTPILETVDRVFAPPAVSQGVRFDDPPIHHEANRVGQAGLVELWPTEKPDPPSDPGVWEPPIIRTDARGPSVRLAERIARCIDGWFARQEVLPSRGRAIQPGDIMILVQRRSAFVDEMVRALKQLDIDSAGIDRLVISDEIGVMDLIALGRFVLLPEDDLTLAVVLRSPLVGLTEEELFSLAYGRGAETLWRTLRKSRHEPRLGEAHAFLAAALARADFVPPFEFYAQVLGAGARRKLVSRLGPEANEPIDELLGRALEFERDHVPSLQGFLHWLYAGNAEVRRDLDHGRDEIRVLTVHGAKGLEAPIVFLPDTCRVPSHDEPLLWPDDGLVLWRPRREREDPLARAAREAAQARQREEYRRLLYVALTRAEDRLYVCGWETRNGRGKDCWHDLVRDALDPIADRVTLDGGGEGLRLDSPQRAAPDRTQSAPGYAAEDLPLPSWAERQVAAEAPAAPPLAPSRPDDEAAAVRSPLSADDQAATRRGFLVHRLLETLPDLAAGDRAAAARRFLAQPALALDDAEAADIAQQTLGVLDDPTFAMLFGPGSRAEVNVSGRVGDRLVSGHIDRLAVSEDEVLVVDYKTNRKPPADESGLPALYRRQMAAYRSLLTTIYPDRTVRCALLWTDAPRLMALEPALLEDL